MFEIPKIVRQRLASAKPEAHPDANLLTAFAEQALSVRDRDSILQHLSQCSECRDLLFLSAPQVEIETEVVPVRSSWLGSSVLRWGALAACAVVVVAAVSLRQRSDRIATFNETSPVVATKAEAPAASQKVEVANADKDRAAMDYKSRADVVKPDERIFNIPPKAKPTLAPSPAARTASEPALAVSVASKNAAPRDLDVFAKKAAPAAPPARAAEQMVATESAAITSDSVEANPGKAKQAAQGNQPSENKVARLEAPAATVGGGVQALFKKTLPRWTLSADGTLQRSLDGGKSWKTIPVAADATLTAVAAMDSDIWVGGSHGSLYHSTDAGDHWAQVVPASSGQSLTSNVIGIEFTDALHGKVTTADQEVWTTTDGGQSWQVSH